MTIPLNISGEATEQVCHEMELEILQKLAYCLDHTTDHVLHTTLCMLQQRLHQAVAILDTRTIIQIHSIVSESFNKLTEAAKVAANMQAIAVMGNLTKAIRDTMAACGDSSRKEMAIRIHVILMELHDKNLPPQVFVEKANDIIRRLNDLRKEL